MAGLALRVNRLYDGVSTLQRNDTMTEDVPKNDEPTADMPPEAVMKLKAAHEAEAANHARLLMDETRHGVFEKAYLAAVAQDMVVRPEGYTHTLGPWRTAKRVRTIIERAGASAMEWQASPAAAIAATNLGLKANSLVHWREWFKGDEAYAALLAFEAKQLEAA